MMNKIIFKQPKTFYNTQNKKYITYFFIYLLLLLNFLLIHKYNIFVGDDAYLLSFIKNFNFLDKTYSILCEKQTDNQILIKILGPFYKIYFESGLSIINYFNLELIWIRVFSFLLFLISFLFFLKILKKTTYKFYFILIFLTLEPFVVMAHSIRHDIVIFLGIIIFFYSIINKRESSLKNNLILFLCWSLLITHPSGYPFLFTSVLFEFFFRRKNFLYSIFIGIFIIFIFLYSKKFLNIENIQNFLHLFNLESTNIRKEAAFTFEKFYDYFWLSKYKRHILEVPIFIIYILNFFYFKKLNLENKFILLIPCNVILIFYLLGYFNVSYLKHLYIACIMCTIIISKDSSFNKFIKNLIILLSCLCFIMFFLIAIIFLPHNSWTNFYSSSLIFNKYISKDRVVSAPFYMLFMNNNMNFIPITALGNNNFYCFPENIKISKIDTIILDTQILAKIKNNDQQYVNLTNYLKNFKLVEKIYVGRLATQSLQMNGFMYIYTKL
jgi:hypothetical protein